jgi:hypothetical protein
MANTTSSILSTLNQTGLQKNDPKLYQSILNILTNLQTVETQLAATVADLAGGIDTQITTADLVGKTITVRNGIIIKFV